MVLGSLVERGCGAYAIYGGRKNFEVTSWG